MAAEGKEILETSQLRDKDQQTGRDNELQKRGGCCRLWGGGGVYVAQVNRRIRSGVDGLVAAMAHLWSKFTKCLRASEGAYNPGVVLATPFEPRIPRRGSERDGTMLRHSVLLHRRYHHLAEPTTAPRIHLSFPIFLLLFFLLYFSTWLGRMLVLLYRNEISLSAIQWKFSTIHCKSLSRNFNT